jgi:hypothetical protein
VRRKRRNHDNCNKPVARSGAEPNPDAHAFADPDAVTNALAVARRHMHRRRHELAAIGVGSERSVHVCDHDCLGMRVDRHHGCDVG